jgi:hypothetical protein
MNEIIDKIARLVQDPSVKIDTTGFIFALLISALVGMVISALYQIFYENRATGSNIHRCFLLMSPSITALFIAIQFSLPLSLGLLGALSIIRFRTPIKEPEEVGFIMLLIACSVICATFQFILLFILLSLSLALLTFPILFPIFHHSKRKDGIMLITLKTEAVSSELKDKFLELLKVNLPKGKLESVAYAENLTTIHYSFTGLNSVNLEGLQTSLNDIIPLKKLNIFFNSQGNLF